MPHIIHSYHCINCGSVSRELHIGTGKPSIHISRLVFGVSLVGSLDFDLDEFGLLLIRGEARWSLVGACSAYALACSSLALGTCRSGRGEKCVDNQETREIGDMILSYRKFNLAARGMDLERQEKLPGIHWHVGTKEEDSNAAFENLQHFRNFKAPAGGTASSLPWTGQHVVNLEVCILHELECLKIRNSHKPASS